jgi:hypothetical protein
MSTSLLERRYRRVLRLLPVGYRQQWEEDMVASFLAAYGSEPMTASRPRLGEVASVVTLAVRARLLALQATPRALAWYHTVRALTLISLLLQSFLVTSMFAFSFGEYAFGVPHYIIVSRAFTMLFVVAAFVALALDRVRAARVIAVLALVATVAGLIAAITIGTLNPPPLGAAEIILGAWIAVTVVAVFSPAPGLRPSPTLWIVLYLAGVHLMAPVIISSHTTLANDAWTWMQFLNPVVLASAGLSVTMGIALSRALRGRERSPHWLLALTPFGLLVGAMNLLAWPIGARFVTIGGIGLPMAHVILWCVSDVALIGLTIASAAVSVRLLRRLSTDRAAIADGLEIPGH